MESVHTDYLSDKKVTARIRKVAREVNTQAKKIVPVCLSVKKPVEQIYGGTKTLSEGNQEFVSIFSSINTIVTAGKRISPDATVELEENLRKVFHLSGFILSEFNYAEESFTKNPKVKKKFGRRTKFMYKYTCDDKAVMQTMRDVRNLFKSIDA